MKAHILLREKTNLTKNWLCSVLGPEVFFLSISVCFWAIISVLRQVHWSVIQTLLSNVITCWNFRCHFCMMSSLGNLEPHSWKVNVPQLPQSPHLVFQSCGDLKTTCSCIIVKILTEGSVSFRQLARLGSNKLKRKLAFCVMLLMFSF